MLGSAAVALIHPYRIHAKRHRLLRNAANVLRIAGTLQAVDRDDGQRIPALRLPVAMAKHLNAGSNLNQAVVYRRQRRRPPQQVACDGLKMPIPNPPARNKRLSRRPHLRSLHISY